MNENIDELNSALSQLIEVFNKHKLRVQDILLVYGNLGYALGASIEGYKDEGPGIEELKQKYNTSPTVGTGLCLQGILLTSWWEDYVNSTKESKSNIDNSPIKDTE